MQGEREQELPELVDEFESYVKAGEPTKVYQSVTGEPYVILTSGGIKLEGAPFSRFYKTKEDAVEGFKSQFSSYCSFKNCYQNNKDNFCLYWRWKPTLREDFDGGFMVYARLLVSDKPIVVEAASVH